LLAYVNLVGVMTASWMAFDAYGKTDVTAIAIFGGGIALAYGLAGFKQLFPAPAVCERRGLCHDGNGHAGDLHHFCIHAANGKPRPKGGGGTGG